MQTQNPTMAEFLVSEANGHRSRATVTVDATAGALVAGTVMGKRTADDAYVEYDAAGEDGSETVAGILFEGIGAETGPRVVIDRDAETNGKIITYPAGSDEATVNAALAGLGIIVRK